MDIKDYKQRKERGYSVQQAVDDVARNASKYEAVAIVAVDKNNAIDLNYTCDSNVELVGLLELTQQTIIEQIRTGK